MYGGGPPLIGLLNGVSLPDRRDRTFLRSRPSPTSRKEEKTLDHLKNSSFPILFFALYEVLLYIPHNPSSSLDMFLFARVLSFSTFFPPPL